MIKADDFIGRVNYAAKCITRMSISGRAFFSCFEMSDGRAVVVALYRRSLKNPKLAANLWRALCESSGTEAVAAFAHVPTRKLSQAAWAERDGHGEEWLAFTAGAQLLICDDCARWFVDESAELVAGMLEAHGMIAHREPADPDAARITALESEGLTHSDAVGVVMAERLKAGLPAMPSPEPDEHADASAALRQTASRGEFRAEAPPIVYICPACRWRHAEAKGGMCPECSAEAAEQAKNVSEGQQTQTATPLTASRDTLRALKLINDAGVLEEKRRAAARDGYAVRASAIFSELLARVRLGEIETIINLAKLDKWAATFDPDTVFRVELTPEGLTLTRGTSYFRLVRPAGLPSNLTPIDLQVSESGEVTAPALPSPAEMKAARRELAQGRKALKVERARQNALRGVNSASADVRRAEEYAAKLEEEARETVRRAEELAEAECDEAVTLAKRVRDLRRLRREVERAAEDPQVNTPEFFEWLTEEHRAAYAEAFPELEKAERRGWHRKAETARKRLASVLRRGFDAHTATDVAEIAYADAEEAAAYSEELADARARERVFGRRYRPSFDINAQVTKRELRRALHRIPEARRAVERAREEYREALESFAPHVRADEHELYVRLAGGFTSPGRALAA